MDAQISVSVVLGGLQVHDDQLSSPALGGQGQIPTGPDLQGGAQGDGQVSIPTSLISKSQVPVRQCIFPV
jgi:hypothetical protein